jgi:hypothetical protein
MKGGFPMLTVQQEDENEDEDEWTIRTEGLEIAEISLRELPNEC